MRKGLLILCTVLLAALSIFLFVIVFPPDGPALPALSPADTPASAPAATPAPTQAERQASAADQMLASMTLDQKVGQLFWARCPESGAAEEIARYSPAGYILFGRDFEGRTQQEVIQNIQSYQDAAAVPMLIGVDEEGGTVVRASKYLRDVPFASPQKVYAARGMSGILSDTHEKDAFLKALGINVNLAPVADVSTDTSDFMYARTFGQSAARTADYVTAVVRTMQEDGMGSVLKHFPGYGPNEDTHTGVAVDQRSVDTFRRQDLLPFQAGIDAGADAVLVSHTIVKAFDSNHPASLSPAIYQLLRDSLGFEGVAVTDDLAMDAIHRYTGDTDAAVCAVQAGSSLLISSDLPTQYQAVYQAAEQGTIAAETIDAAVRRVLVWKMALGLIPFADGEAQT